jgi:hypothetical protein
MKRLFIIIAIILTANAASAQICGLLGYIKEKPAYTFFDDPFAVKIGTDGRFVYTLTPQKFQQIINETTWMKDYLSTKTYSFFKDGKFYMLSYDTCSNCDRFPSYGKPIERGLFSFCLDNGNWTKACYEPVQIDHYSLDSAIFIPNKPDHCIWSAYCYFPWRTAGDRPEDKGQFGDGVKDGSGTVSANGEVTIVLVNHKYYHDTHSKYGQKVSFENKTIVLVSNNDGTYKVQ